jgi:hypothetical protein
LFDFLPFRHRRLAFSNATSLTLALFHEVLAPDLSNNLCTPWSSVIAWVAVQAFLLSLRTDTASMGTLAGGDCISAHLNRIEATFVCGFEYEVSTRSTAVFALDSN